MQTNGAEYIYQGDETFEILTKTDDNGWIYVINLPDGEYDIDIEGDGIADINIDVDGDGKADTNIDTNDNAKADLNLDINISA